MSSVSSHPTTAEPAGGIPRRDFLKLSAAAVLGSQFLGLVTQEARASQLPGKMNLLLILSDQERAIRWFPAGWEAQNLPTMTRLKHNGLTFSNAFTTTSMCSPSRNTLFTGLFPAQHRLVDTLTEFEDQESQRQLDPTLNPHDLLSYPLTYDSGGYTDPSWLTPTDPPIALPPTIGENLQLNKKPSAQRDTLNYLAAGLGPLVTEANQTNYLNFYGNWLKPVDSQLGQLLAVMDQGGAAGNQMLNNTLIIRAADHGENGLCHGGLRQKMFVAYGETIRVPLIWSNPTLYPSPQTSAALVSHVDFLPTICDLTGVPNWAAKGFKGVSYSSIVMNPAAPPVQDYVLFTFDDIYADTDPANAQQGLVPPPNRLQMIRTADYKYVRYYDGGGGTAEQSEFYDLRSGGGNYDTTYGLPLEMRNLSTWAVNNFPIPPSLTLEQIRARNELTNNLAAAAASRLQPRPANAPLSPEQLKLAVVRYPDSGGAQVKVQITFLSRADETYQVQKSNNLVDSDFGDSIVGNNGLIPDKAGAPTFDRVMYGLEVLKAHAVEFNTLSVVHRASARQPLEVYRFLKEAGAKYLQFIPLVERLPGPAGATDGLRVAPPLQPGQQLFDVSLGIWLGRPSGLCLFSPKCGDAVALERNGDVYSCDHFVHPGFKLGNLLQSSLGELVRSPRQRLFSEARADTLPVFCRGCDVRFACQGECPKNRFLRAPDGEWGLNYLCAAYQRFFHHVNPVMRQMAYLALSGRAPAEIMARSGGNGPGGPTTSD